MDFGFTGLGVEFWIGRIIAGRRSFARARGSWSRCGLAGGWLIERCHIVGIDVELFEPVIGIGDDMGFGVVRDRAFVGGDEQVEERFAGHGARATATGGGHEASIIGDNDEPAGGMICGDEMLNDRVGIGGLAGVTELDRAEVVAFEWFGIAVTDNDAALAGEARGFEMAANIGGSVDRAPSGQHMRAVQDVICVDEDSHEEFGFANGDW